MLSLLRRLFECDTTPASARPTRFQLESLDGREMPAVLNFSTPAFTPALLTGVEDKAGVFTRSPALAGFTIVPNSRLALGNSLRYRSYSNDQNGVLTCYSPATGTHTVTGAIREKYLSLGGATGFLGYPTTDTAVTPNAGGWYSTFQNGSIYWSAATGAHVVYGAILAKYQAMGGPAGLAGFPTSDEMDARGGRVSRFQGADIYWGSATGSHEVHGAIRDKYNASGYGLPLTDETACPDGVGRFNHFDGGSIYWTPATGARLVYGAIRDKWASLGWERSGLGYPTSDERPGAAGGRANDFQNGRIDWSGPTGVRVGALQLKNVPGGAAQFDNWSCGPNSASRVLRYYGINVSYETMRNVVQYDGDLFSRVHLGTRPGTLLDAVRRFKPDVRLTERSDLNAGLDPILAALDRGRPVMALVNVGGTKDIASVRVFGHEVFTGGHLPDALHWIVVKGYDRATQTVTLMNTNGREETWSYATFMQRWNWSAGGAVGDFLTGTLGVRERTFIC